VSPQDLAHVLVLGVRREGVLSPTALQNPIIQEVEVRTDRVVVRLTSDHYLKVFMKDLPYWSIFRATPEGAVSYLDEELFSVYKDHLEGIFQGGCSDD
jgi:hypothetical protein